MGVVTRLQPCEWMPEMERDLLLAKAREAENERQSETRSVAAHGGARWSAEDESYLIENWNRSTTRDHPWSKPPGR